MTDDYIPQPRPQLSDEAAALLLDFLYDLITDFESATQARSVGTIRPRLRITASTSNFPGPPTQTAIYSEIRKTRRLTAAESRWPTLDNDDQRAIKQRAHTHYEYER